MCLCQCERRDFSTRNARQIFLFLLLCAEQEQRLGDSDRLMGGNKRRHVSVPTPKQNCGPSVIALRQTKSAIFLWHLDSKRADFRKSIEIFWRNFTGTIDLVRIDMFAQITFQLLQKIFACGTIFSALRRIRINPIEIVTADKKVAGETAAVFEWIARGLRQFQRFTLAFRHLRRVNNGGSRLLWLRARFLSDLFFGRFERGFHGSTGVTPVGTPGILPGVSLILNFIIGSRRDARLPHRHDACATSAFIKFRSIAGVLFQYLARRKFLLSLPAVPAHRRLSSIQNVPRNVTVHLGTARNRFPKSFRSLHPRANRRLSLPRSAQLH